jgi:RNA 2',3'-cyclic 3'-phosphodiesterase
MIEPPAPTASKPVRTFVAVFPPPEIRAAAIAGARETVRRLGDRVRWIKPENVHLTLKFLGDVREEALGNLCAPLGEICARHAPFDVGLVGLGAFPSARRARILWVGVGAGSDQLRALAADLDAAFASLGFEREKRSYAPHMTLGRVRGRPASFDLPSDAGDHLGFRVRRVELVESTLAPEGAVYGTVRAFALGEKKLENEP